MEVQAETYLDTTISSLAKRKQQLEEDLTYVQEELGAIARCHCWVPLLANAACHCWVPLLGCEPLLGCHCWVPLLGAIAECHCWVSLLGGHCWVPCWGAIAGCHSWVPLRGKLTRVLYRSPLPFSILITNKLVCAIWGLCWYNVFLNQNVLCLNLYDRHSTTVLLGLPKSGKNTSEYIYMCVPI